MQTAFLEGFKVYLKTDKLPFVAKPEKNKFKMFLGIDSSEKELEKFMRVLEKKFREVIWYIGTDFLGDEIVERFMFAKSGFLEISVGSKPEIKAFFSRKQKAEKFAKALQKVFEYYKIRIKQEEILLDKK